MAADRVLGAATRRRREVRLRQRRFPREVLHVKLSTPPHGHRLVREDRGKGKEGWLTKSVIAKVHTAMMTEFDSLAAFLSDDILSKTRNHYPRVGPRGDPNGDGGEVEAFNET